MVIKMKLQMTAVGVLWALAVQARAVTTSDFCSGPVRVGLFEYGVMYQSATHDGLDAQLLTVLEKRTGCSIERVVRPRARIWKEMEAGTLDMTTAAVKTPERNVLYFFVPYMQTRNVLIVRKDAAPHPLSPQAFVAGKLRLGVVRSFRHEPAYEALVTTLAQQGRVTEATDVTEQLRMLDHKVVNAVLSQPVVYGATLTDARLKRDFVVYDWAPDDQSSIGAMALSRKSFSADQARQWDALMVSLQRDGTLQKLSRKYLGVLASQDLIYTGKRLLD